MDLSLKLAEAAAEVVAVVHTEEEDHLPVVEEEVVVLLSHPLPSLLPAAAEVEALASIRAGIRADHGAERRRSG
jgi:hypothetical protein